MTYVAKISLTSRAPAVFISAALHVALGIALLTSFKSGKPDADSQPGEQGQALVVELLPLTDEGPVGKGHEQDDSNNHSEKADPVNSAGASGSPPESGVADRLGTPPPAEGDIMETNGLAQAEDSRDSAPSLSGAEIEAYRTRLLHHIERFRRYPPEARDAGHEGVVRVQFVIDQSGNATEVWVELSSGSALLDDEAVSAIMRASPLPVPPSHWPQSFGVSLPIGFSLQ